MKKLFSLVLVFSIFLSIFLVSSQVFAQEISVYIDGRKVFFDVPPTKIEGRTLVPLRAIFEGLGAFVEYDTPTRTITATKSNIKVQLTLDNPEAIVNGQKRILDVPAMSLSGRTLVPLRFVGEAFGDDVKWEGTTSSIFIETEGSPDSVEYPTPVPTPVESPVGGPVIYSLTHNVISEIGPGYSIEVTLIGTSGGEAKFDIAGIITGVPMFEKRTGVYMGTYTVKKTDTVKNASVTGYLTAGGVGAVPVQAGEPISISSGETTQEQVVIYSVTHNAEKVLGPGEVITVTLIGTSGCLAFFDIGDSITDIPMGEVRTGVYEGSYTVKSSDKGKSLPLKGKLIKGEIAATPLEADQKISIGALVENVVIYTVAHNATGDLKAGDVLEVTLVGTPEGKASFDIGDILKGIAMTEIQPGVYKGSYTVKNTDSITNGIIYGYLTKSGVSAPVTQASNPVNLGSVAPTVTEDLKIYSFTHNATGPLKVGDELKVILVGLPEGISSFDITNFRAGFPMEEIQPGVYQGVYKISAGDSVTEGVVLGHFSKGGKVAPLIEAATPVTISGISPKISEVYPGDEAVIKTDRPNIYVTFDVENGSLINPETVKLVVDGIDVSSQVSRTPNFVTFYPSSPLPVRRNIWVELTARDDNGNQVFNRWRFVIVPRSRSLISSAYHNGQLPLVSGKKLEVTILGTPGAVAWFEIENFQTYIPMVEIEGGKYTGEYPVGQSDNVKGAKLTVHLKTQTQEDTLVVEPPVTFDTEQVFSAPSLIDLQEGAQVSFPLEIRGYTKPFAVVEIRYEYKSAIFGSPLVLEGLAGTSRISADEKGYFSDKYYSVWGSGTKHKITVTATDTTGKQSPSTVINVVEK